MGNIGTGHGKFEIGKMEDKRHEELEFDIHSPWSRQNIDFSRCWLVKFRLQQVHLLPYPEWPGSAKASPRHCYAKQWIESLGYLWATAFQESKHVPPSKKSTLLGGLHGRKFFPRDHPLYGKCAKRSSSCPSCGHLSGSSWTAASVPRVRCLRQKLPSTKMFASWSRSWCFPSCYLSLSLSWWFLSCSLAALSQSWCSSSGSHAKSHSQVRPRLGLQLRKPCTLPIEKNLRAAGAGTLLPHYPRRFEIENAKSENCKKKSHINKMVENDYLLAKTPKRAENCWHLDGVFQKAR